MIAIIRTMAWTSEVLPLILSVESKATVFMPPAIVLVFGAGGVSLTDDMIGRVAIFVKDTKEFIVETTLKPALYKGHVIICAQDEDRGLSAARLASRRAKLVRRELVRRGVNRVMIVAPDECGTGWAGRAAVQIQTVPF